MAETTKEGFYRLEFLGAAGVGVGVIVLEWGMIVGADAGGVIYDGTYSYARREELLDLELTVRVPPGASLVQGVPALALPHSFWARARIPRCFTGTQIFDAD